MQTKCSQVSDLLTDTPPLQVLIGLEARLEREVIAGAIASLRPSWAVIPLTPVELESTLPCRGADVVLCTTVTPVIDTFATAWITLDPEGIQPSRISIEGQERVSEILTLEELIALIETIRD